jgi:hypothetical protein
MADEDVLELLRLMLMQMEAQQQALVKLTEVLDHYLKDPVRVDVVANAPKITLTENNNVGIHPQHNHVVVDNFRDIRDRNAPGVEPFQRLLEAASTGFPATPGETAINVPGGKRIVIEFITIVSKTGDVFLRTIAGGNTVKHPLIGGPVRIYGDSGSSVFLRAEPGSTGLAGANAKVIVSGHLVNE